MIISFTGTQVGMTDKQKGELRNRLKELRPLLFVHGGCVGADDEADAIAASEGIDRLIIVGPYGPKRVLDLKWQNRGSNFIIKDFKVASPLKRNPIIVRAGVRLIACPQQMKEIIRSGTWTTVRIARRLGKDVEVIEP